MAAILVAFTLFVHPQAALAANWGCFSKGMLEWMMPGLGYGINGEYAKMGLIGGTRWAVDRQYFKAIQSEDYQEDYG
ncbi:MAG: hypothetical protein RRB13_14470 [bacterium]|nr:hypothetical protein [bacterium]